MKPVRWHDIAELIGIAALVASLTFVGLQMRQAHTFAMTQRWATELSNTIEESNIIVEHADVWIKGNAGEALTAVEEVVFSRLVQLVNDRAWYGAQQSRLLGLPGGPEIETAVFAGFLYDNPGARRVWRTREAKLQRYRTVAIPDEQLTPLWIGSVEHYLAAFERNAGLAPTGSASQ
jgi:hypothetical protein